MKPTLVARKNSLAQTLGFLAASSAIVALSLSCNSGGEPQEELQQTTAHYQEEGLPPLNEWALPPFPSFRGGLVGDRQLTHLLPVSGRTNFTKQDFAHAWEKLNTPGMEGIEYALIEAERTYNVSALVLASIAALESAWGTSTIAQEKNNLTGLGAYDSDPYGYAFSFERRGDSVLATAKLLREKYLTPGAAYYNGDTLEGIGVCYATDPEWAAKVEKIARVILQAITEEVE